MKKGNTTIEQLLYILDDNVLYQQLLHGSDDCSFLNGTLSRRECLDEFSRVLNSTVLIMKRNKNFHYLSLIIKILEKLYLEQMKEDPFSFYENKACLNLLELYQKYPGELAPFGEFLSKIRFEYYQNEIGRYYHKQMKKSKILNDFELNDLLKYLMIYKNHLMPHHYLRYLFYVLFEKNHEFRISSEIYAELFRFLILDLFEQLGFQDHVKVVSLKDDIPFIYEGNDLYINREVIKTTLEENLSYLPYLFDLLEKRNKYQSFVHNKYEEIKSRKQYTIKEILGIEPFYEQFSYLSIEKEIVDQSLISRLRFFEDVSPSLYQRIIEDYEQQIIKAVKNKKSEISEKPILTLDELLDKIVLEKTSVLHTFPYLMTDYHSDGTRKSIIELLMSYEKEIELSKKGNKEIHKDLARYYEQTILTTSLDISKIIEEIMTILKYEIRYSETEVLLEKIFCEYFVGEFFDNLEKKCLTYESLEILLSKINEYFTKFYEVEQKRISRYVIKDHEKWLFASNHLKCLYHYVEYMSKPELYENAELHLTQVLDLKYAKEIEKKVLKKKIVSQKVYMVILVILILIFSISLFLLGRILWHHWSANNSYNKIQEQMGATKPIPNKVLEVDPDRDEFPINDDIPQIDFEPLKSENEEVVAWVRIDGTEINYPVSQGENNEFYLNHLYNKKYNISGSVFMDYRNNTDFTSENTILYAHNLRNGTMFGSLKKYKNEEYLKEHKYVWLITPDATYQYEIYAAYEFDSAKDKYEFNFDSEESFLDYLENIKEKSIISSDLEVTPKDHILTLSTCTDENGSKRFIVIAKRIVKYVVIDNNMSSNATEEKIED